MRGCLESSGELLWANRVSLKPLVFDKKFYLGCCIQTKSSAFRQVYRYLRSDESSCTLIDYRARLMMVHNGNASFEASCQTQKHLEQLPPQLFPSSGNQSSTWYRNAICWTISLITGHDDFVDLNFGPPLPNPEVGRWEPLFQTRKRP